MKILVLNCGSSSLKFRMFEINNSEKNLVHGIVERIGSESATISCERNQTRDAPTPAEKSSLNGMLKIPDHNAAIEMICSLLTSKQSGLIGDKTEISGIGHRVVHGGEEFFDSVLIDHEVIAGIERCSRLAPLHNPPALLGIRACMNVFSGIPQVAVFDTAIHRTIPEKAYRYGIPEEFYTKYGIRKYGFHGTSHRYVSREAARLMEKPIEETKIISCHMGNGSSITAVRGGLSIDTTMGLTPLSGVIMGTRPGDLDPYIPIFLIKELGMSADEVDTILNKKSGFEGICHHHDVREIEEFARRGDKSCALALEMFAYRASRFIGGTAMALNGADAIVFTGGIGEHDADMRGRILENSSHLGVKINPERNRRNALRISDDNSKVAVFVIPTNEELIIAQDTSRLVRAFDEERAAMAVR